MPDIAEVDDFSPTVPTCLRQKADLLDHSVLLELTDDDLRELFKIHLNSGNLPGADQ